MAMKNITEAARVATSSVMPFQTSSGNRWMIMELVADTLVITPSRMNQKAWVRRAWRTVKFCSSPDVDAAGA